MFRVDFLKKHHISFENQLSSTADRYYLLTCKQFGQMKFYEDIIPLYYRVTPNSMSNNISVSLVRDNELYYKLLKKNKLIPQKIWNNSLTLGDYILFASYWKIGARFRALKHGIGGFFRNPIRFLGKILK